MGVVTGAGVVVTGAGVIVTGAGVVTAGAGVIAAGAGVTAAGAGVVAAGAGVVAAGAGVVAAGAPVGALLGAPVGALLGDPEGEPEGEPEGNSDGDWATVGLKHTAIQMNAVATMVEESFMVLACLLVVDELQKVGCCRGEETDGLRASIDKIVSEQRTSVLLALLSFSTGGNPNWRAPHVTTQNARALIEQ